MRATFLRWAPPNDRFTRREFQRILDVTDKQLAYWEKLGFVSPRKDGADKFYDFRDLISLRTAKQLIENGVSANRLRPLSGRAKSEALRGRKRRSPNCASSPTAATSSSSTDGAHLEPISGQFVLNFDTRELRDKVRFMPERNAKTGSHSPCNTKPTPNARCKPSTPTAACSRQLPRTSTPSSISACSPTNRATSKTLPPVFSAPSTSTRKRRSPLQPRQRPRRTRPTRSRPPAPPHRRPPGPPLRRRPLQPGLRLRQTRLRLRSPPALAALHPPGPRQPVVRLRPPAPRLAVTLTRTLHCCASACRG